MLAKLKAEGIDVEPGPSPDAIRHTDEGRAIFESRTMKGRRLQVMELGSQLLALLCAPRVGSTVLDWCAGAGGKSLFLADLVGPTFAADHERTQSRPFTETRFIGVQ